MIVEIIYVIKKKIFFSTQIDMDLILTLSDNDLQEIGIKDEAERTSILTAIKIYQSIEM